jgi:hypothetical protein
MQAGNALTTDRDICYLEVVHCSCVIRIAVRVMRGRAVCSVQVSVPTLRTVVEHEASK